MHRLLCCIFFLHIFFLENSSAQLALEFDINQKPSASAPRDFIQAGNVLYFLADDTTFGEEIWKKRKSGLRLGGGVGCMKVVDLVRKGDGMGQWAHMARAFDRVRGCIWQTPRKGCVDGGGYRMRPAPPQQKGRNFQRFKASRCQLTCVVIVDGGRARRDQMDALRDRAPLTDG